MAPGALAIGAASRPYPGETSNGDAWRVDWYQGACRIAVIDGLGHGIHAAAAAAAALDVLGMRPDLSPGDSLSACHVALGATRGAAISIATIDAAAGQLIFAGIGNVDGHLVRDGRQERLVAYRGIIGGALTSVRAFPFSLGADWLLLIHTDGIRARFKIDELPRALQTDPQQLADAILEGWSRDTDDATIVVIRPTGAIADNHEAVARLVQLQAV